jgi:signal transduction histidine kinase
MFFPDYNWFVVIRVEYIVHYTTFAMVIYFMYRLFPKLLHKRLVIGYLVISGTLILISVLADMTISSHIIRYYDAASVALALWVLIRLAVSLRQAQLQNLLGFTGMFVLTVFAVNDMIGRYTALNTPFQYNLSFTAPVGMVFFMLCYAMALALDFAETERRVIETVAETVALNRINLLKTDLMTTISHETRTPLAVISSYTELIAMELRALGVNEQHAKDLDTVSNEIQHIAQLMDEMQNFSRFKNEGTEKILTSLTNLIPQTARLYSHILERRETKINVELPETLPSVYINPGELSQVLYNLLQNARNHTQGGEVTIKACAINNGTYIEISVADTGEGIPPDLLPRIFERGVTSRDSGMGIGLAVCREIIMSHGGEIKIESESGKGTAVRFTLPVAGS